MQRTAARLKAPDRGILAMLDIVEDTFRPSYRGDIEAEDRARFVHDLRFGSLIAIGYLTPRTEHSRPRLIPKEVWINAQLDWDRAEVSGAGWSFTHVQLVMSDNFPEARDTDVYGEPLPELAPFARSEDARRRWGIPAIPRDADPAPLRDSETTRVPEPPADTNSARMGRPSFKDGIRHAYDDLKSQEGMTDKQLFQAIRDLVKERLGLTSDRGLSDSAIQKHVIRFRKEEAARKN